MADDPMHTSAAGREAEHKAFLRAFDAAGQVLATDPWWTALDAHSQTYAREAVGNTLMGWETRSGRSQARVFALSSAPKQQIDAWERRILSAVERAKAVLDA